MTNPIEWLATALALLALTGCGKEVGRLPFSSEGRKSTVLALSPGDVAFWTDLDIQYEGVAAADYHIDLSQAGHSVATAVCDPLGPMSVQLGWLETQHSAKRSKSGRGEMTCSATLAKGGPTTVEVTLAFRSKPAVLALSKADLVVKQ